LHHRVKKMLAQCRHPRWMPAQCRHSWNHHGPVGSSWRKPNHAGTGKRPGNVNGPEVWAEVVFGWEPANSWRGKPNGSRGETESQTQWVLFGTHPKPGESWPPTNPKHGRWCDWWVVGHKAGQPVVGQSPGL